jgi:hypothetical protein
MVKDHAQPNQISFDEFCLFLFPHDKTASRKERERVKAIKQRVSIKSIVAAKKFVARTRKNIATRLSFAGNAAIGGGASDPGVGVSASLVAQALGDALTLAQAQANAEEEEKPETEGGGVEQLDVEEETELN